MKTQALLQFPYPSLTLVALFLFLSVFVGATLWVFRRSAQDEYRRIAALPLEKEETHG